MTCTLLSAATTAFANTSEFHHLDYRVDPTARNVLRLDADAQARLAVGDPVLVLFDGQAGGAGRLTEVTAESAVAELAWLEWGLPERGRALVVPGDLAARLAGHLPPSVAWNPRRASPSSQPRPDAGAPDLKDPLVRLRAQVGAVHANGPAQLVELDAERPLALGIGDRLDLYRGARYVAFAKVVAVEPGAVRAETLPSLCAGAVEVGDVAVRRLPPGATVTRYGYVFRREPGYVLVSLGEADGVRRGDHLYARSAEGGRYRLVVDRTYPDHCGATVEKSGGSLPCEPSAWDPVCPGRFPRLAVSILPSARRATESRWLVAVPSAALPERTCQGDLVIWGNRSDVVGVVLLVGSTEAFVYVPGIFTVSTQEGLGDGQGSAH